jgi:Type II CAAX prenyl endopeptidase Rce1-like
MIRTRWPIVEPAAAFLLIMLYIWRLRYTAPATWMVILALLILSHVVRGERAAGLGFRWNNFGECLEALGPALALLALLMLAGGMLFETIRRMSLDQGLLLVTGYCVWGLFQQYLLNGYLANRLRAVVAERRVPLMAAAAFSAAHLPNWFLMLVTFGLGYYSTKLYIKYRNVYVLGLAHGIIGSLLFVVVPDSVSHSLRVGPGFFVR